MRYFISDTHFCHDEIISLQNRPFRNTSEMDKYMIEQWKKTVRPEDEVIFGGDFACASPDIARSICDMLPGRKILVKGNHDRSEKTMLAIGFSEVHSYLELRTGYGPILVVHKPKRVTAKLERAARNGHYNYILYGHTHSHLIPKSRWINMSVEQNAYTPQTLDNLIEAHTLERGRLFSLP